MREEAGLICCIWKKLKLAWTTSFQIYNSQTLHIHGDMDVNVLRLITSFYFLALLNNMANLETLDLFL